MLLKGPIKANNAENGTPAPTASPTPAYTGPVRTKAKDIEWWEIYNDMTGYVEENLDTETESINDLEIIPYNEKDLLVENAAFWFGIDLGIYAHMSSREYSFRHMIGEYPDPVLRRADENFIYAVYETDKGTRAYVFFDNGYFRISGTTIIMNQKLSYKDFKDLKVGDPLEAVAAIDSIIPYYKEYRFDRCTEDMVKARPEIEFFTSYHLLTDGIMKIKFNKKFAEGEYTIKEILFREDFILPGIRGDTCYRIREGDYKE